MKNKIQKNIYKMTDTKVDWQYRDSTMSPNVLGPSLKSYFNEEKLLYADGKELDIPLLKEGIALRGSITALMFVSLYTNKLQSGFDPNGRATKAYFIPSQAMNKWFGQSPSLYMKEGKDKVPNTKNLTTFQVMAENKNRRIPVNPANMPTSALQEITSLNSYKPDDLKDPPAEFVDNLRYLQVPVKIESTVGRYFSDQVPQVTSLVQDYFSLPFTVPDIGDFLSYPVPQITQITQQYTSVLDTLNDPTNLQKMQNEWKLIRNAMDSYKLPRNYDFLY